MHFASWLLGMWIFFLSHAYARPVSYLGGSSIMSETHHDRSELMANYSWHRSNAIGAHAVAFRAEELQQYYAGPELHSLLLRHNAEGRQSNIYASGGYGVFWGQDVKQQGAGIFNLQLDSETRNWYGSLQQQQMWADQGPVRSHSRLRLGFNPYLVEMNNLHIWMVLQYEQQSWVRTGRVATLLRFFFQNVLWELGSGIDGSLHFNWGVEL